MLLKPKQEAKKWRGMRRSIPNVNNGQLYLSETDTANELEYLRFKRKEREKKLKRKLSNFLQYQ